MKSVIKDIRSIRDSKEMYESQPHPFIAIFIYLVLIMIIGAGVWAYFGEIDIVSKGQGVVRPNASLSSIRNKTAGEVAYCNLVEGQEVKAGDVLFTIDKRQLEISLLQEEEILKELANEKQRLQKLRDSIEKGQNLFSKEQEVEDYERYVKYVQDYEELANSNTIAAKDEALTVQQTEINASIYEEKIEKYEANYKELKEYEASILTEQNQFTDHTCTSALAFTAYLYDMEELRADIASKKSTFELNKSLAEEGMVAEKDFRDSEKAWILAENKLVSLKSETLENIKTETDQLETEIKTAKYELGKLIVDESLIAHKAEQRELALKKYKTDYLINLYDEIEANESAYKAQKKELESIELSLKSCDITAPIDGTVHIITNLAVGDLIASGDNIATIIPSEDELYAIEIFVPNSEIAGLKVGDTIAYQFDALPYKEYGELEGIITSISSDSHVSETYGMSGYTVEGSIVNKPLYSYKGEMAEIKVGMTCTAHVITEQKKILYYLLEKINLKD